MFKRLYNIRESVSLRRTRGRLVYGNPCAVAVYYVMSYSSIIETQPQGDALPDVQEALGALLRLQIRAIWMLAVRVLLLSFLLTIIRMLVPGIRRFDFALDAVSGALALWPFWTSIGRNWRWRIKLADAFLKAGRADDTRVILEPLKGIQASLFDADGKGRILRTEAINRTNDTK